MSEHTETRRLHREMGFVDLLLFLVITSLGIMSLAKAGEAGPAGVTFWVIAAFVFYLPLALCVIILSSRYPGEGGLYLWSHEAFGAFAGFITGWAYWVSILPALPAFLYVIAGSAIYLGGRQWQHLAHDPAYFILASLACLALVTVLNVVGLRVGKWLHNAGAVGTWVAAVVLIVLAFLAWAEHGPATNLAAEQFVPTVGLREAVLWSVMVASLTGLEAASVFGGEIKNPRRLPLAIVLAAVLVIVTRIVGTLAVLVAIPAEELSGSGSFMQAVDRVSARAGVRALLPAVALLVVIGHVGGLGAWSATGARLPMVAGLDRSLPAAFARIHPRWGSPYVALLFQALVVAVLVVIGQAGTSTKGAFDVFLSMTLIPTFIPFVYMFAAAIKVQGGEPGSGRMRTPVGRWAAKSICGLGLLTTVVSTGLAVLPPSDEPSKGLYVVKVVGLAILLLGAGVLVYLAGRRRSEQGGTADPPQPAPR
jgi:glutamate:GABA antiporter